MPSVFLPFFPFVNGTVISADEMNADLAALRDGTLSTTGDTMNGPFLFDPDNLYDIGEPTDNRPRSVYIGTSLTVPIVTMTTVNATTVNVSNDVIVNDTVQALHFTGFDIVLTGGVSSPNYYGGTFNGTFVGDGSGITNVTHPAVHETVTGQWTFAAPILMTSPVPVLYFSETDAAVDGKNWRFIAEGGVFYLQTTNDPLAAISVVGTVFRVSRTGVVPNIFIFDTDTVRIPQGSASAPALAFAVDVDTGIFLPAPAVINVSLGGGSRAIFSGDDVNGSTNLNLRDTTGTRQVNMAAGSPFMSSHLHIESGDFGIQAGGQIHLGRNTAGYAAHLALMNKDGVNGFLWVDATGMLRIHDDAPGGFPPTSDTAGVVVGTQTSIAASKDLLGPGIAPYDALQKVVGTPVYRFRYKQGFPGEEFDGIVTDDAPHFGMDQGKSLNVVNAIGYLVQSVKALTLEVAALKRRVPDA